MLDRPTPLSSKVLDLAKQGLTGREIADRLPEYAYEAVNSAFRRLRVDGSIPSLARRRGGLCRGTYRTLNVAVSDHVYASLAFHARARNISVSRLVARIADASIDCVDAILDDGV